MGKRKSTSKAKSTSKRSSAQRQFALGLDFGTASARALIVDIADGAEIASATFDFPTGDGGVITDAKDPNLARQNPADYIKAFEKTITAALEQAGRVKGFSPDRIVGIGTDGTGSTPIPVDAKARPLALQKEFKKNVNAMAWLWKDHTAYQEAHEITTKAREQRDPYLAKCGGTYSSEWFWSKILRCHRADARVFSAATTWVEQSDWLAAYLTGVSDITNIVRNVCAAGHKGMYHESWGGWPRHGFLASLGPELVNVCRTLAPKAVTSDHCAGELDAKIARKVGLPAGIPVAAGIIDAHAGAVGAGIRPGSLVKIIGTSTCDMMVAPLSKDLVDVPGLCGIVPGSVLPDCYGLEAGQSAVGDLFNWCAQNLAPPEYAAKGDVHENLTAAAEKLKPGESGLLALDWNNGNRTILVDPRVTGMLVGQTLHTTAPEIYRALIEATAFGALIIIKQFESYGVKVTDVINCGGITEANPLLMQIYADVCNRPMKLSGSPQTCALGAAIFGAVAGGGHKDVADAQKAMAGLSDTVYRPRKAAAEIYQRLFGLYRQLHDVFGTSDYKGSLHRVMKDLLEIRDEVRK